MEPSCYHIEAVVSEINEFMKEKRSDIEYYMAREDSEIVFPDQTDYAALPIKLMAAIDSIIKLSEFIGAYEGDSELYRYISGLKIGVDSDEYSKALSLQAATNEKQ